MAKGQTIGLTQNTPARNHVMPPSKHHGFTMIELIVAIVIVAVLAATALPKFINIGSNARAARVDAMAAQLYAAASSVRAECMVKVHNCANRSTMLWLYKGKYIKIVGGVVDAGDYVGGTQIDTLVTTTGWTVSIIPVSTHVFSLTDAPTPANCSVRYVAPVNKDFVITTTKTGC